MKQINCYIPIKLHITGRPSDVQLDTLGETLMRTLTARIALAEDTITDRINGAPSSGIAESAQEAFNAARETATAEGYRLPSFNGGGELRVVAWRRRIQTGRIPRHLRAAILTRGTARVPTRNVRWILELNRAGERSGWINALAVGLDEFISAIPEVDITVELYRLQDPELISMGSGLAHAFQGYLERRHTSEIPTTPYFIFFVDRVGVFWNLQAALGMSIRSLFRRARLPLPNEMTGRQRQRHVLLTYVSFPAEVERFIPREFHYAGEQVRTDLSTASGEELEPAETPEQLIDRFTSWNFLDEEGLGEFLAELTRRSPALSRYVMRVLDELDSTDRDDVALAFAQAASQGDLSRLRSNIYGLALLERLFHELTEGSLAEDEQRQANRLLIVRAQRRSVESAAEQLIGGPRLIFPFRMPGPTVLDDAIISAEIIGGGRIRVRMPTRTRNTSMFAAETATLPYRVFGSGLILEADEWVGVRLYDEGGMLIHVPALYLVQLSNQTNTRTIENIINVAALAATFGTGGLAIRGATWGARTLAILDTAATVLFAVSIVVRDHRGWIIRTFGETGRTVVNAVEVAGALAGVYGIGRVVMATPRIVANLRNAWRNWRASRAYQNLSPDDFQRAEQISREIEQFLNNADEARSAAGIETGPPAGVAGAVDESTQIVLYRGTVYRFVRGRSRFVHDLGDGVYMTLDRELAVRYAQERRVQIQSSEPGAPGIVLRAEAEVDELGRVFDFYNNQALRAEWEAFVARQPGGEMVLRGGPAEVYNGHFQNWLQSKGLRLDQFDVIIGPEYIRGGSQVCIRNEQIADTLLRRSEEWARAHTPVTPAYPEVPGQPLE